jgi:hypothetical protein
MEFTSAYNERAQTSATYYWDDILNHQDIMKFFQAVVSMRLQNVHDSARYIDICVISPATPDELKARIQSVLAATQSRNDVVTYKDLAYGINIRDEERVQEFAWQCGDRYYLLHFSYDDDLYCRSYP